MKTVFIVTSGSYDDYQIDGVFSSVKLAEEFMSAVPPASFQEYNDIKEVEVDLSITELIKSGYSVWQITMKKDGSIDDLPESKTDNNTIVDLPCFHMYPRRGEFHRILDSRVWAKSADEALHIVNDKRLEMIANNEWK